MICVTLNLLREVSMKKIENIAKITTFNVHQLFKIAWNSTILSILRPPLKYVVARTILNKFSAVPVVPSGLDCVI